MIDNGSRESAIHAGLRRRAANRCGRGWGIQRANSSLPFESCWREWRAKSQADMLTQLASHRWLGDSIANSCGPVKVWKQARLCETSVLRNKYLLFGQTTSTRSWLALCTQSSLTERKASFVFHAFFFLQYYPARCTGYRLMGVLLSKAI